MKIQPIDINKIFLKGLLGKELVSIICKELSKLNNKNNFKKQAKDLIYK